MSRMVQRPREIPIAWPRPPGTPTGRVHFGTVDSGKNFGPSSTTQRPMKAVWQDNLQVNPAHNQPKLIWYSGAQPFIRTHHLQLIRRTFMTAGPRFIGRWLYAGYLQQQYKDRARMTGNPSRLGRTYRYPSFVTKPREIQLG